MKDVRKDVAKLKTLVDGNKLKEADKLFETVKVCVCIYMNFCGRR